MSFVFLFQNPSAGGGTALVIGALAIILIAIAAAFIAFKLLKKTVKMAVRMTIVVIILLAAVLGSFALFWFGSGSTSGSTNQRPRASLTR